MKLEHSTTYITLLCAHALGLQGLHIARRLGVSRDKQASGAVRSVCLTPAYASDSEGCRGRSASSRLLPRPPPQSLPRWLPLVLPLSPSGVAAGDDGTAVPRRSAGVGYNRISASCSAPAVTPTTFNPCRYQSPARTACMNHMTLRDSQRSTHDGRRYVREWRATWQRQAASPATKHCNGAAAVCRTSRVASNARPHAHLVNSVETAVGTGNPSATPVRMTLRCGHSVRDRRQTASATTSHSQCVA